MKRKQKRKDKEEEEEEEEGGGGDGKETPTTFSAVVVVFFQPFRKRLSFVWSEADSPDVGSDAPGAGNAAQRATIILEIGWRVLFIFLSFFLSFFLFGVWSLELESGSAPPGGEWGVIGKATVFVIDGRRSVAR